MSEVLTQDNPRSADGAASHALMQNFSAALDYFTDSFQRSILFLDVLRQRGNQYHNHLAEAAPHVLDYDVELLVDGRKLDRPVNYALVRIVPPAGISLDPNLRPFIIVDPRAGHGPGIGGFKADSEIGVAFKAGHSCYFIGFLPDPVPGQTIEDIARAEAIFIEKVMAEHPKANGKPCVIGNCQAGWAIMMLAAIRPELFGPIIIAGSPLSYWAGIRGKNPMRYSGGLLGGSWLAAFASDLGDGKFDGAWLVQNFENQNPANTLWTKQYNLYSKIDTEAPRYLGFERWWGGHVNLNAEEIQFIVDELFIGNKLAAGLIQTSDGRTIDLRNIRSPIVIFCSKGDNITPPQQALDWILDLYENVEEIRSYGQTIVYTIHESIGHLGIFVSSGVAKKEHGEFSSNIDFIDTLPPGLYEAKFENKTDELTNPDLVIGNWVMRCEARTLDDIRALGGNDMADECRFATAARVSEINLSLYRTFVQPFVRAFVNPQLSEWMRRMHPLRLQYEIFSDSNPMMGPIVQSTEHIRQNRKALSKDNPFLAMQERVSDQVVAGLELWREFYETAAERTFLTLYGSPLLQSAVGIDTSGAQPLRKAAKSPLHRELLQKRIVELKARIPVGGVREAIVRALIYIGMQRAAIDERGFELTRRIRKAEGEGSLAEFKALVREQFNILLIDQKAALAAIPAMLPDDLATRQKAYDLIKQIMSARAKLSAEDKERMDEIAQLFGLDNKNGTQDNARHVSNKQRAKSHGSSQRGRKEKEKLS
jgi:pimeloyl-ACP methyl ester carboxylesterase